MSKMQEIGVVLTVSALFMLFLNSCALLPFVPAPLVQLDRASTLFAVAKLTADRPPKTATQLMAEYVKDNIEELNREDEYENSIDTNIVVVSIEP